MIVEIQVDESIESGIIRVIHEVYGNIPVQITKSDTNKYTIEAEITEEVFKNILDIFESKGLIAQVL